VDEKDLLAQIGRNASDVADLWQRASDRETLSGINSRMPRIETDPPLTRQRQRTDKTTTPHPPPAPPEAVSGHTSGRRFRGGRIMRTLAAPHRDHGEAL